jgi:hypothetical protein
MDVLVVEVMAPSGAEKSSWWELRDSTEAATATAGASATAASGPSSSSSSAVASHSEDYQQRSKAEWDRAREWLGLKGYTVLRQRFGGDLVAVRTQCIDTAS